MFTTVLSVIVVVAAVGSVIALAIVPRIDARDRKSELDARAFFDEHGHWPDEAPGETEDLGALGDLHRR